MTTFDGPDTVQKGLDRLSGYIETLMSERGYVNSEWQRVSCIDRTEPPLPDVLTVAFIMTKGKMRHVLQLRFDESKQEAHAIIDGVCQDCDEYHELPAAIQNFRLPVKDQ